ncbi:MAG: MBL fold metallo-hydrolase RNA specificity domain-containing protein [Candidatus Zixiibacteriota bacterium]
MISLSFHGAVGTVTGSKYLLTTNDYKVLIDCGIFQGAKVLRQKNWESPAFNPKDINSVVLTHAHIDHIGYLPRLLRDGFSKSVYATAPTVEMAKILLLDTAHINEEDASYRNRKKATSHKIALPLFTTEDTKKVFNLFKAVNYCQWVKLNKEVKFRYHNVGHILGAGSVEFRINDNGKKTSILFSGDIGRYAMPLTIEPSAPPETDYLICESTYGGVIHEPLDIFFEFAKLLDDIIKRKSILLIPSFAVGRTQQMTYIINVLIKQKRIPPIDVHIDSPMAVKVTDIYRRFPSFHSINCDLLKNEKNVFYGKNVFLHRKRKSSKLLNKLKGPAIIISASGMLSGGRILHHLINRLPDKDTTVALVSYMAEGTLGRKLLEGSDMVYIHKIPIKVRARIVSFLGLSGHADSYEIFHWLAHWDKSPKKVFITHGEPSRSDALAKDINNIKGWNCHIPYPDETIEL